MKVEMKVTTNQILANFVFFYYFSFCFVESIFVLCVIEKKRLWKRSFISMISFLFHSVHSDVFFLYVYKSFLFQIQKCPSCIFQTIHMATCFNFFFLFLFVCLCDNFSMQQNSFEQRLAVSQTHDSYRHSDRMWRRKGDDNNSTSFLITKQFPVKNLFIGKFFENEVSTQAKLIPFSLQQQYHVVVAFIFALVR